MTISFINRNEWNVTAIQLLSLEYNIYPTGPKANDCVVGILKDRSHFQKGLVEAIRQFSQWCTQWYMYPNSSIKCV